MELGQWIAINRKNDRGCYVGKITHITGKMVRFKQSDNHYENTVPKSHIIFCGSEDSCKRLKAVWDGLKSTYYERMKKSEAWFQEQTKALIEAMTNLQNPIFTDNEKARLHLEGIRWPNGAYCAHCGEKENVHRMNGDSHQSGMLYCRTCRKKFTVTVGTIFERSHVPLTKWLLAYHLMCASKKGMSAHQLHRMLGVTYKTAWFMAHRIRESMKPGDPSPLGGNKRLLQIRHSRSSRSLSSLKDS